MPPDDVMCYATPPDDVMVFQIAKWSILEQDFSVAGGELSELCEGVSGYTLCTLAFTIIPLSLVTLQLAPTMKLKRSFILKKYADCIDTFYIT